MLTIHILARITASKNKEECSKHILESNSKNNDLASKWKQVLIQRKFGHIRTKISVGEKPTRLPIGNRNTIPITHLLFSRLVLRSILH